MLQAMISKPKNYTRKPRTRETAKMMYYRKNCYLKYSDSCVDNM